MLRTFWDYGQEFLQCCGIDGPSDWFDKHLISWSLLRFYREQEQQNVPLSCQFSGNSTVSTSDDVGCIEKVSIYLSDHFPVVLIVSAAIMVFQVSISSPFSHLIPHYHIPGDWSVSFMLSGKISPSGALGWILTKAWRDHMQILTLDSHTNFTEHLHGIYSIYTTNKELIKVKWTQS